MALTVREILKRHDERLQDLEKRLGAIGFWQAQPEQIQLSGETWEVSGDQIAVWSTNTDRPLSWTQGRWARLRAGRVEARGDAFDFRSAASGARIIFDDTGLSLYSAAKRTVFLDAATGDAEFEGTVTASAGVIGGWTITSTELHNTDIWLDAAAKQIAIKSQTFGAAGLQAEYDSANAAAKFYVGDGANAFFQFDGSKVTWKAANTELDASGNLSASNAIISGTITATAGQIGGWTITSTELHNTDIWLDATAKQIAIKSQTFGNAGIQLEYNAGSPRLYVGDGANAFLQFDGSKLTWKAANTELDASGNITANNATISGTITTSNLTADGGTIGGWSITSSVLQKLSANVGIILDSTIPAVKVGNTGDTYILIDGANGQVGVSNFSSGVRGWRIDANGDAEFNNITARGVFRTPVFLKDEVTAIGGSFLVAEVDALTSDVTTPSSTGSSFTFKCEHNYFAVNDIVRCKPDGTRQFWATITGISGTGPYTYTATFNSGNANTTFYAGEAVVNYGSNGQGLVQLTATLANAPFINIFTHAGSPWSSLTERVRIGKLDGITDPKFGSLSGYGIWTDNGYFTGKIKATSGELQTLDITGFLLLTGSGTIWTSSGLPSLRLDANGLKAYDSGANVVSQLDASTGKLWSKLGGFGGTFDNPKIVLNTDGTVSLKDLSVEGTLTLSGSGKIITAASPNPRIELTTSLLAGYSDATTKEFYIDAATGKAYFAGGNAVLSASGIELSDTLDIIFTHTQTSGTIKGLNNVVTANPGSDSAVDTWGAFLKAQSQSGNAHNIGTLIGAIGTASHYGGGTTDEVVGVYASAFARNGCGNLDELTGVWSYGIVEASSGDIQNVYLFKGMMAVNALSGTINTAYGLMLPDMSTNALTSYGVYQDGTNDINLFKGKIRLENDLEFDSGDYLDYDTANNYFRFFIGNTQRLQIGAGAITALYASGNACYFDGLMKPKFMIIDVSTAQSPAATWTWYNVTGASVSWTSYTTEHILAIGQSHWHKGTAGDNDFVQLRWNLDSGAVYDEFFRFTFEHDDWPQRPACWFWTNLSAGSHSLQLQFRSSSTGPTIHKQRFFIWRIKA